MMNKYITHKFANTLIIIVLMIGTFFLFRSCSAQADELTYESQWEIEQFYFGKKLSAVDYKFYSKLRKQHLEDAIIHYDNVHMACWYCPRISDQQKAQMCYNSAWSLLGTTHH